MGTLTDELSTGRVNDRTCPLSFAIVFTMRLDEAEEVCAGVFGGNAVGVYPGEVLSGEIVYVPIAGNKPGFPNRD